MNQFTWLDEFSIDNQLIDAQHQHIFELANKVFASNDKLVIRDCALGLFKYIREHFKAEEQLMQQINYPDYQNHVQAHNELLLRLTEISAPLNGNEFNNSHLNQLMTDWLMTHILQEDMKIGEFIHQNDWPSINIKASLSN